MSRLYNLSLLFIFLFISVSCFSQDRNFELDPEKISIKITDRLKTELTLTEKQDSLVYDAYLNFFSTLAMFRDVEGFEDEMKQVREKHYLCLWISGGKSRLILPSGKFNNFFSATISSVNLSFIFKFKIPGSVEYKNNFSNFLFLKSSIV